MRVLRYDAFRLLCDDSAYNLMKRLIKGVFLMDPPSKSPAHRIAEAFKP